MIFRAFYAIPASIKSPAGLPVNGVRGFLDMLARLIRDRRPARLAVATDEDWRPQFRVAALPSYKAHRVAEPVPKELEPQLPVIWQVLDAVGLAIVRAPGFEAEDVIASLASRIEGRIEIVSGDRDLFALVRDPDVVVLYPEGPNKLARFDEAEINRRYGISGRAYLDYAILRGDPSDGLPGVKGIGTKTATGLLHRYGSLDGLLQAGALNAEAVEYVNRARQVVPPVTTIDLQVPDARVPVTPADPDRLLALAEEYGITSPATRLVQALTANV